MESLVFTDGEMDQSGRVAESPGTGENPISALARLNSERLINNLIQAAPRQAGFLRRVHESLQRRFPGPWKDHRQRTKNRNRRLFRVGSAV
jgi:hypothetical protein